MDYVEEIKQLTLDLSFFNRTLLEELQQTPNNISKENWVFTQEDTGLYDLYTLHTPFSMSIMNAHFSDSHYFSHIDSTLNFTSLASNKFLRSHKHNYFEFLYVLDGQIDLLIEGERHHYQRGEACIINQNTKHVEELRDDFIGVYLNLTREFFENSLPRGKSMKSTSVLAKFFEKNIIEAQGVDYIEFTPIFNDETKLIPIEKTLYQITVELKDSLPGSSKIIYGLVERLFTYLQTASNYSYANIHFPENESRNLFEKTIHYINANKRKLTRKELSEALHYNGNYISQVFLNYTGQTLAIYIRNICLKQASYLLLNTTLSISEIIKELGFENRTAFYTQFKKKFGVTPHQYRLLSK